jgi:hypothetical protein
MLFKDILDRKSSEVRPEFIALNEKIWQKPKALCGFVECEGERLL